MVKPKIRTIELPYACCMESTVSIVNMMTSTTLVEDFGLVKMMGSGLKGVEYNRSRFSGLGYRIEKSRAAFLIFTSGKMACTGAKAIEDAHMDIINLAKKLKGIYFEKIYLESEIRVQNIVANADLKTSINLNTIAIAFGWRMLNTSLKYFRGLFIE